MGKKEQQCDSLMVAFIKLYEISWLRNENKIDIN